MKPRFNEKYKGIRCRVYLVRETKSNEIIHISEKADVYNLVREELVNADREIFLSIMLTIKNDLIGVETVSIGCIHSTVITPRDVFKSAILANAVSIVLCHNHPSGDLAPSDNDLVLTKTLIKAGELLGIKVLDHIVVSNQGYRSLRDYNQFPI
jgi:DNA repair protein RadC